ncbi:MAG: carboxypeptidase regulatory-like domain-containing protein [Syntrophobacteraceae bacterium]|nr:carboxypeptidase regulatory-like domain-containing protein [Syntrophobacteraceae bacterium]
MKRSSIKFQLFSVYAAVFALLVVGVMTGSQDAAAQSGGVIKGKVDSPWVSRYEAIVYVDQVRGNFAPPKKNPFMGQKNLVFKPHVMGIVKGTTVDFTNNDDVAHNVSSPHGSAKVFNLGLYGAGVTKTVTFDNLGEVPLLCSVHPEMSAFILVLQNPYFAVTDKAGNFEIKGVPPGNYQLKVWHEKLQTSSQSVAVGAGKTATVEFKNLNRR